jgi:hypothetical protein
MERGGCLGGSALWMCESVPSVLHKSLSSSTTTTFDSLWHRSYSLYLRLKVWGCTGAFLLFGDSWESLNVQACRQAYPDFSPSPPPSSPPPPSPPREMTMRAGRGCPVSKTNLVLTSVCLWETGGNLILRKLSFHPPDAFQNRHTHISPAKRESVARIKECQKTLNYRYNFKILIRERCCGSWISFSNDAYWGKSLQHVSIPSCL